MTTLTQSPLSSDELVLLESLLPYATEAELEAIEENLLGIPPLKMAKRSPRRFRELLLIDCDGIARIADEAHEPWQRADFEAIDPAWECMLGLRPDAPKMRAYLERPRGHSKTSDIAVMVAWVLYASEHPIRGVAAAGDKEQAGLLRNAINMLVSLNPWLGLDVQNYRVVNKETGAELVIISNDEANSYGETPHFIIVDEMTHWKKRGLWDSLVSSAAKRARCVMVAISNAGLGQGVSWQWEARESCRNEKGWHFSRLDGVQASWITAEILAEQRRLLPGLAYVRLWDNRWVADSGEGLPMDQVEAAASILTGPDDSRIADCEIVVAGLDLGLTRDHAGYVEIGISRTGGVYRLAHVQSWAPTDFSDNRINLGYVKQHIIDRHSERSLSIVGYDPYQAARVAEELEEAGIPTAAIAFTPVNCSAMALRLMRVFSDQEIELFPHRRLLRDLARLVIKERLEGFKLEAKADEQGHADTGFAMVIAVFVAVAWVTEMEMGSGT